MNTIPNDQALPAGVAAGLAEPSIAALDAGGAPVLVASSAPFAIVWANEAAFSLFAADDLGVLTGLFSEASDHGFRRMRELAGSLLPGAPARLERLRFFLDGHAQMITFMCRRTSAPTLFIAGAMGVRPKLRVRPVAPVATLVSEIVEAAAPDALQSKQDRPETSTAPKEATHVAGTTSSGHAPTIATIAAATALAVGANYLAVGEAPPGAALFDEKDKVATLADENIEPAVSPDAPPESDDGDEVPATNAADAAIAPHVADEAPIETLTKVSALDQLRQLHAQKYPGASRLRFLWRTDSSGRLTQIGDALKDVIGAEVAGFEGAPATALLDAYKADADGALSAALAGRETFSPVEVNWPLNDAGAHVRVTMGALPSFDRARRFDGFKGFGVIHLDRLVEDLKSDASEEADVQASQLASSMAAAATAEVLPVEEHVAQQSAVDPTATPETAEEADTAIGRDIDETEAVEAEDVDVEPETVEEEEPSAANTTSETEPASETLSNAIKSLDSDDADAATASAVALVGAGDLRATIAPVEAGQICAEEETPIIANDDGEDEAETDFSPGLADQEQEAEAASTAEVETKEAETTDSGSTEPEAILRAENEADATAAESEVVGWTEDAQAPETEPDAASRFAHAPNVVSLRPFQTNVRFQPPVEPQVELPASSSDDAASLSLADVVASGDEPVATTEKPGEKAQLITAPSEPGVSLSSSERNAFREIARALGAKVKSNNELVAEQAKADARLRQPPETQDAAGDQSREAVQAKRQETERSLARIRDLLQISSANDDKAPEAVEPPPALLPVAAAIAPAFDAVSLEANSAALFDRLPFGILVSRGGVPIYGNRNLLDSLGYKDIDQLHDAGGLERMFRGREPDALTKEADGGAIPVISADGEVSAFEVRMQSIDWGGEPASVMTFRRSGELELQQKIKTLEMDARQREAETRELHAILDTATDGVVVIDNGGRILAMNRSAEALFGYEQNEIAGEHFRSLLTNESHAAADEYLNGLKSNGVASVLNDGREIIGRARQGGPIPMFMTIGRIGAGEASKFCAVLRDITQWKKAERELKDARRDAERASALKSDFLAKISHEIRTPLNAILGFAEVIVEERFGPVGNERYKDYLKDIHSSGTHVMSLVNDLLDLSKIEAGKVDLNFGAVDANKIIADCASLMQPQAIRERVIVRMALAPRLPQIVADERSLKQIVLNLLSNALKFNEPGGQVIISTALTDAGNAVLRIKDTGIGMTDAEVETALEPFRQIATSRPTTGTGLGLPLTKALVEANRASFTIKSKKREGTLVEVSFPSTRVLAE